MDFAQNRRHVAQLLKNEAYLMTHDLEQLFDQASQDINKVSQDLGQMAHDFEGTKTTMASFQDDETRLEADIQANADATVKVQATLADNQTQIQTLQDALAAQKAQGMDTTAMEAALAKLESNTQVLAQLPPVPAATVAASTGTSADAVAAP